MHSIHRCVKIEVSTNLEDRSHEYGIKNLAEVLVEGRLARRARHLPGDVLRLCVEAMAAASLRDGHRVLCGMVCCRLDLCQTVVAEIWHAGLARGVDNWSGWRPFHWRALVLLSLVNGRIPTLSKP